MATIRKRTQRDGLARYTVQIRKKGHKPVVATFGRLEDAKKWARDAETKVERNVYFAEDEATRRTLDETITRYLKESAKQKDRHERERQLQWWRGQIGPLTLSQITPSKLSECKAMLVAGTYSKSDEPGATRFSRAPATVNRYLSALSHVLSVAEREWQWISYNAMRRVSKLKEPRGRVRYLSDDERHALLTACSRSKNRNLLPIVMLALLTGARKGEITSLKWSQIDSKRRVAVLHETKNGERRVLPLARPAWEALESHGKVRRINSTYIFSMINADSPATIDDAWGSAVSSAGLEDLRFHDLRHSCASYLAMNGATSGEIAEVLGHKTLAMVKRYSHLSEKHVANVLERMADKVFAA